MGWLIYTTLDAPEVETDREWIHCGEGESVTIICRVYSNPVARVRLLLLQLSVENCDKI